MSCFMRHVAVMSFLFAASLQTVAAFAASEADIQKPSVNAAPGSQAAQSTAFTADLNEFQTTYATYIKRVSQREQSVSFWHATMKPNELLRNLVSLAFEEARDLDKVQMMLKGIVEWQPMPSSVGSGMRNYGMETGTISESQLKLPIVLFKQIKTDGGILVTVMQNSFAADNFGDLVRGRLEPYAAVVADHDVQVGDLTLVSARSSRQPAPYMTVLDFVLLDYPVPAIVTWSGPEGSGSFAEYSAFIYDLRSKRWLDLAGSELAPVFEWRYNPESGLVALTDKDGQTETEELKIDIHDVAREALRIFREGKASDLDGK